MTLACPRLSSCTRILPVATLSLNFQGYRSCRSVTVTITTKCLCAVCTCLCPCVSTHTIVFLFDAHYHLVYKTLMNKYYITDVQNCLIDKFPSHGDLDGTYAAFSHEIINSEIS